MYRKIVVPLDASPFAEAALAPAAEIAGAEGATLLLLAVADIESTVAELHQVASRLPRDLSAEVMVDRGGGVAKAIADAAAAPDTLLCMTSHGRSGVARLALGNVAASVLGRCSEPVLLVGPRYQAGTPLVGGQMVVPLDGSALAAEAIAGALAFGKAFEMRLWLVNVVPGHLPAPPPDALEAALVEQIAEELWHEHHPIEFDVLHGDDPAEAIVGFASRLPAAMITMTTHGRTGLRAVAAGSVATRVVHSARCPVLVRRPAHERRDLRPSDR